MSVLLFLPFWFLPSLGSSFFSSSVLFVSAVVSPVLSSAFPSSLCPVLPSLLPPCRFLLCLCPLPFLSVVCLASFPFFSLLGLFRLSLLICRFLSVSLPLPSASPSSSAFFPRPKKKKKPERRRAGPPPPAAMCPSPSRSLLLVAFSLSGFLLSFAWSVFPYMVSFPSPSLPVRTLSPRRSHLLFLRVCSFFSSALPTRTKEKTK